MAFESTPKTRGPNVEITTDYLAIETRSFDCSALSPAPQMGEWINVATTHGGAATRVAAGPGHRCVFAERGRSDTQALNYKRTPVLYNRPYQAKFYQWRDSAGANLAAAAAALAPGALLTVTARTGATDTGLYVLSQALTGDVWVVGYSCEAPTAQDAHITAYIYDAPRLTTVP
jgi:hypothetical protein